MKSLGADTGRESLLLAFRGHDRRSEDGAGTTLSRTLPPPEIPGPGRSAAGRREGEEEVRQSRGIVVDGAADGGGGAVGGRGRESHFPLGP